MSLDDLAWLSYARLEYVSGNNVVMTTENYKSLLKYAHEQEIRTDEDKNPVSPSGRVFLGAGLGFNSAMGFAGYVF